jgi:predicted house-cleaning noncanonical NTP pyrophosphatase (MazG superfamily)
MRKVFHRKLIRDRIPEHIESQGEKYEVRVMEKKEFEEELKKKLVEEAKELIKAPKKELLNELADVLELIKSIAKHYKIDFKLVEEKQVKKRKERGGFKKRLFLIWSSRRSGE